MRMPWTVSDEVRAMTLVIDTEPVPLAGDVEGVARVGGTRVTLDTLVAAFEQGATAEEIAQQYPSLGLADVYAVISYYLRRRDEVRAYLAAREQRAGAVQAENQAHFAPEGLRDRLLARRRA